MAPSPARAPRGPGWAYRAAALGLLLVLAGELALSVRQQSQTVDEAVHLFAGYQYWRHRDFGANPEHPPLVKLVAALPLLFLDLKDTPVVRGPTKRVHNDAALDFLYNNNVPAGTLLMRARLAASVFTLLLAVLVFLCGYEMFGPGPGLLALALLVFEPNILAHGALITTDAAATCFLFASVYAFYRYLRQPGAGRLAVCGAAVALALVSKHSGLVVLPMLVLLALPELLRHGAGTPPALPSRKKSSKQKPRIRQKAAGPGPASSDSFARRAGRWAGAFAVIATIAFAGLWACYAFRFAARPGGEELNPPLDAYVSVLHRGAGYVVSTLASVHVLPESYLWGLTDVLRITQSGVTFLLGRIYIDGPWFYFPAVLLMKATLGLLALLAAFPFVAKRFGAELRFLIVPPALYLAVSMFSALNIGVRHILPVFPFLVLIAAGTAAAWAARSRVAVYAAGLLLAAHAASSLDAYPNYLAYANEGAGGPSNSYRVMADSNVDWGQELTQAAAYLAAHDVHDCWFAYRNPDVKPSRYGVPCRPLPSGYTRVGASLTEPIPSRIDGTILIGTDEASGQEWGPGELNPYQQFFDGRPDAVIAGSVLVFHGSYDVRLAAALDHAQRAERFAANERMDDALREATLAVQLAPASAEAHAILCRALESQPREAQAQPECERALAIAQSVHPDYQFARIPAIRDLEASR